MDSFSRHCSPPLPSPAAPSPRSRRIRRRALRLSRESDIPSLSFLRLPPPPPPPPPATFRATLHALFHKELHSRPHGDEEEEELEDSPLYASGDGYDERRLPLSRWSSQVTDACGGTLRAAADAAGRSDWSSGGSDGDVSSDAGDDAVEVVRRTDLCSQEDDWDDEELGERLSSSAMQLAPYGGGFDGLESLGERGKKKNKKKRTGSRSLSSHGFLLLPSAECVASGDDGAGSLDVEDWELQAEVLAAECNLLRVENELVLRKWKRSYYSQSFLCGASEPNEGRSDHHHDREESLQSLLEKMHAMHDTTTQFAHATLRRLQDISRKASCSLSYDGEESQLVSDEVSDDDCGSGMNLKFHNVWDTPVDSENDFSTKDIRTYERCLVEDDTLKKQVDSMLPEIPLAGNRVSRQEFIRRQYRSMLSSEDNFETQQILAEDLTYRAAIQQMVTQVQAEVEQWSQVQDVLHNLQNEMDNLNEARQIWEERALRAEACVSSLKESVHNWRQRAQDAEVEVSRLETKSQILRRKIRSMKQRHSAERASWLECEAGMTKPQLPSEASPETEVQKTVCSVVSTVVAEMEEKPRPANVGTREDYALCESIVHSRNESTRSSFDLGAFSLKGLHKRNKKSFDFSNSSNDSNTGKSKAKNQKLGDQLLKIDSARLDFCSKTSDVNRKVGGQKNHHHHNNKFSEPSPTVELTRLEMMEPLHGGDEEAKTVRLFGDDENSQPCAISSYESAFSEIHIQDELQARLSVSRHGKLRQSHSSKPPKSFPHPPAPSKSSRVPFGEIINSPISRILKTRNF